MIFIQTALKCKILVIPKNQILSLLTPIDEDRFTLISRILLPVDVKVNNIWYDPEYRAFMFMLESEEYEPVVEGCSVPKMAFNNEMVQLVKTENYNYEGWLSNY